MNGSRFDSPVWLLRGISSLPGQMDLVDGWLSLRLLGEGNAWDWQLRKLARLTADSDLIDRLLDGQRPLVFRERLENLSIDWPWYYFRGGLVVTAGEARWRISFGPPVGNVGNRSLESALDNLNTVVSMRAIGKRWLQAIESACRPLEPDRVARDTALSPESKRAMPGPGRRSNRRNVRARWRRG